MQIQQADLSTLMELVKKSVARRWGWHKCFEDLLQESYLGAWNALTDREAEVEQSPAPGEDPFCRRVARRGGLSAAVEWLRGPQNQDRRVSRRGKPLPRQVSLEALAFAPSVADFSDGVCGRLDEEERVARWLALGLVSDEEWEILRRTLLEGEALPEVADSLGINYSTAKRRRRQVLLRLAEAEQARER